MAAPYEERDGFVSPLVDGLCLRLKAEFPKERRLTSGVGATSFEINATLYQVSCRELSWAGGHIDLTVSIIGVHVSKKNLFPFSYTGSGMATHTMPKIYGGKPPLQNANEKRARLSAQYGTNLWRNDEFLGYDMEGNDQVLFMVEKLGPFTDANYTTGYKFETLSTIPDIWARTSRDYIEGREEELVSNKAQYCSVVRTGVGNPILCLGGEVDARKF